MCWRVRVDFDASLDTLAVTVRDFLPPGQTFESAQLGANNTVPSGDVTFDALVAPPTWTIGTVDAGAKVFEVVVSSITTTPTAADGDLLQNLAKLSYENRAGVVFQDRAQADVEMAAPLVTLGKGIARVNAAVPPGAPAPNVQVQAGDTVTYSLIVDNAGSVPVSALSIRDVLPAGITCAEPHRRRRSPTAASAARGASTGRDSRWVRPLR